MSLLAQCGFGRANKIERGLETEIIDGVIMSPRDEVKPRLEDAIVTWRNDFPDSVILFDPQFYATTLNSPRDGHLGEYEYYGNNTGLGRTRFSATRMRKYVKECIDYQHNTFGNNLSYIISPSILFDDFRDHWSQVAIDFAVESSDYWEGLNNPQPLLISIIFSETALQSLDALDEFLDAITELDVEGFYIIVKRNTNSLQHAMERSSFARFMYFLYVLGEINQYYLLVGYSDWHSFLLESVGVDLTASGWYQNLRQFSMSRFLPATGGRRPRKRYSSKPMLSCPLINPELQDIYMAGLIDHVLTGSANDSILSNGPTSGESNWTDEISCLSHWESLSLLSRQIVSNSSVVDRLQMAFNLVNDAQNLYTQLYHSGINFDPSTTDQNHLGDWLAALDEFRAIARI